MYAMLRIADRSIRVSLAKLQKGSSDFLLLPDTGFVRRLVGPGFRSKLSLKNRAFPF